MGLGYYWTIKSPSNFYCLAIVLVGSDSASISHFNYGKKIIKMQLMWLNSWVCWTLKKKGKKVNFNEFWDHKDTSGGWISQVFNLRMCIEKLSELCSYKSGSLHVYKASVQSPYICLMTNRHLTEAQPRTHMGWNSSPSWEYLYWDAATSKY